MKSGKYKLMHELFVGKVTVILGFDKTLEILEECKEAMNTLDNGSEK